MPPRGILIGATATLLGLAMFGFQNCSRAGSGDSNTGGTVVTNNCVITAFGAQCGGSSGPSGSNGSNGSNGSTGSTGGNSNGTTAPPPPGAHGFIYKLTPISDPNGYISNSGQYANAPYSGSMSLLTAQTLVPNLDFYATQINAPLQSSLNGFPGLSSLQEWFGFCFDGTWTAPTAGNYTFVTLVDDAVAISIDNQLVFENDDGNVGTTNLAANTGKNPISGPQAFTTTVPNPGLTAGPHPVQIMYYQGWPDNLALQIWVLPPGVTYTSPSQLTTANLMQLSAPTALSCPH